APGRGRGHLRGRAAQGGPGGAARPGRPRPAAARPRAGRSRRRLVVHARRRLEGDESRAEAALRELAEETGITDVALGPVLWRRRCSFPFAGRRWDQDEWYYLARTTRTATAATALTELERRSVAGARWWTCRELARTHETVYPTRLAGLLRTLLDEGPPAEPVTLDTEIV
ncbi:LOW QUALITY PROTEIN: MutT/NUDIX family protein, partial [Streptomyces sp. e14]